VGDLVIAIQHAIPAMAQESRRHPLTVSPDLRRRRQRGRGRTRAPVETIGDG
jgi:hypothetical protein